MIRTKKCNYCTVTTILPHFTKSGISQEISHDSQCITSVLHWTVTASILYQQGYRPCEYPLPPGLPGPVIVVPVWVCCWRTRSRLATWWPVSKQKVKVMTLESATETLNCTKHQS